MPLLELGHAGLVFSLNLLLIPVGFKGRGEQLQDAIALPSSHLCSLASCSLTRSLKTLVMSCSICLSLVTCVAWMEDVGCVGGGVSLGEVTMTHPLLLQLVQQVGIHGRHARVARRGMQSERDG